MSKRTRKSFILAKTETEYGTDSTPDGSNLVYTTDLTLSVETLVRYYKLRWGFETNMRDTKEELGFDQYQVHSQRSIERSVLLSFVAASLTQLVAWPAFEHAHTKTFPSLEQGLAQMGIHCILRNPVLWAGSEFSGFAL